MQTLVSGYFVAIKNMNWLRISLVSLRKSGESICLFLTQFVPLYKGNNNKGLPISVGKNPPANAGDLGSVPGLGRSPGKENGNLLPVFLPE